MRVAPPKKTTEAPATLGTNALLKKTGAFEQVLHPAESDANKEQKSQVAAAIDAQALSSNPGLDNVLPILSPVPESNKPSPIASHTAPVSSTQIQSIAREIVSEIRSVVNKDGSQTVDIQFNSKTLEGLQVRITEQQGNLSVQFATPSETVAALLADHKTDLANALAADGFTVSNISTSLQPKRAGYAVTRDRNGKQGR